MRRDSWRSVPTMWRPPSSRTSSPSALHDAFVPLRRARRTPRARPRGSRFCSLNSSFASISGLPPRMMSVPRPAMLVETVIAPLRPACATTYASFSWCFAFRTLCGILFFLRMRAIAPLFSTLVVPTRTGWPFSCVLEDLVDDRGELLALGLVDEVFVVVADDRLVRRDDDDVELVGAVELVGLGVGRAGHARRASCRGGRGSGT